MMMAILVVLLVGCAMPAQEPGTSGMDQPSEERGVELAGQKFAISQDAEIDHYVGAVDDQLFIGVAIAEGDADDTGPQTVAVYLCDSRDVSQWARGEITGQETTLDAGDTSVDVTLAEDRVSGTVALEEEAPQPFTAELVTGDAGMYRATVIQGGDPYHLDWIVLSDGRQRGPLDGKGNDIPPPPPPSLQ